MENEQITNRGIVIPTHKNVAETNGVLLDNCETGGIIRDDRNHTLIFKHPKHRLHPNGVADTAVLRGDAVEIPYRYDRYIPMHETHKRCVDHLVMLKAGRRPAYSSTGVELENTLITQDLVLAENVFQESDNSNGQIRPELMNSTLEVATGLNNGTHLIGPVAVARGVGEAAMIAVQTAEKLDCLCDFSSTPSVNGNRHNTPIPYLDRFAPIVKADAAEHSGSIPPETKLIYDKSNMPVNEILAPDANSLDWPMLATHVHFGLVADNEGKIDPRVALVTGQILLSPMANVIRAALSSSRHLYGHEHNVRDARSIAKRLLHTTHESSIPDNYPTYVHDSISAVIDGRVPDISRFTGGHDRVRVVTPKGTIEDIGAPSSDPRSQVALALAQEIIQVIAVEALAENHGDERAAIQSLTANYGDLLTPIPSIGDGSDHEWWVRFNENGYNDPEISEQTRKAVSIIERVGRECQILSTSSRIVNHLVACASDTPSNSGIAERLGINDDGKYDSTLKPTGLITDYKKGDITEETLKTQHLAMKRQAEEMQKIETEEKLLKFYGLLA